MSDAAVPPSGRVPPVISSRADRCARWLLEREGFALAMLFAACFLGPLVRSPLILGDLKSSLIPGLEQVTGRTVSELSRQALADDLAAGRFAPLAAVGDPWIGRYLGGALVQKWSMLALVLSNIALFHALLRRWTVPHGLAAIGVVGLAMLFAMRVADDPLLTGHGWMQAAMGLVLAALWAFERARGPASRTWLSASVAMYTLAMLVDDSSRVCGLVFVAVALARESNWRTAFRETRFHLFSAATLFAIATALRLGFAIPGGVGYQNALVAAQDGTHRLARGDRRPPAELSGAL